MEAIFRVGFEDGIFGAWDIDLVGVTEERWASLREWEIWGDSYLVGQVKEPDPTI